MNRIQHNLTVKIKIFWDGKYHPPRNSKNLQKVLLQAIEDGLEKSDLWRNVEEHEIQLDHFEETLDEQGRFL